MTLRCVYLWNLRIRNSNSAALFTQTLTIYSSMLQSGVHGNEFTFPLLLKACSFLNSLRHGTILHSHALQLGFQAHVFVQTALLDMYSKCSHLLSSRKVFDEMPVRTVVSWNSIISAYSRSLLLDQAFLLLNETRLHLRFQPNSTTFLTLLPTCFLPQGLSIHCCIFKLGLLNFQHNIPLTNALLTMYVKHRLLHEARSIFDMMLQKSVISWTTIIAGYVDIGYVSQAFHMFNQMRTSITPDSIAFIKLISACAQARQGNLLVASSLHSLLLKNGFHNRHPIDNLLVTMYAKCGHLISARTVFDMVHEKSVFLWTSIIGAYNQLGYPVEALDLFKGLLRTTIKPNKATLATILSACADMGSLSMGEEIEEYVLVHGLQSDPQVQTSLIHMFSRCGSIDKATLVFKRLWNKDLAAWSSMINGYAIHGKGEEALSLFQEMQKAGGIRADATIYTSILLACSHSGLVKEGLKHFQSMQKDFGIQPTIEHFTCLVDLLGRAGQLELALKTIEEMPLKVQALVWAPFLSACRKHCNVQLGELASRKLSDVNPESIGSYVEMANLYASAAKWKEAAVTRSLFVERGLIKEPGWSQVEINGSVHVFIAGDRSHRLVDMYKKLEELNVKVLEAGYVAEKDTCDL